MATLSEVGPGSFDSYEGIRIVIPGLLAYGVAVATFRTVAPSENTALLENPITGIVAALAIGLLLYFLDIPARAASYAKNQPTDYLNEQYPDKPRNELLTAYFLLLNTRMPANTRNRALYMGSMFRIGMEMILILAAASSAVFGAALFSYGPDRGVASAQAHRIAAASLVVVFILAVWGSAASGTSATGRRLKKFFNAFAAWSMVVYAIGLALIAVPAVATGLHKWSALQYHSVAVAGLLTSIAYWNWRYIRGDRSSKAANSTREPLDSPFAGLLFLAPIVISLVLYTPHDKNILPNSGYLIGWTVAAGVVIVMVVIRGHERKLHGVYFGQTRWLKDSHEEVSTFLGVKSATAATCSEPLRVDIAVADVKVVSGQAGLLNAMRRLLSSKL